MPAYNEGAVIGKVISDLKVGGLKNIIVVNDGSTDNTENKAKRAGAKVINHIVNIGVGGATSTGLAYAKRCSSQIIVTVDADGQHTTEDVKKVTDYLTYTGADIVIGARLKHMKEVNKFRYFINKMSNTLTRMLVVHDVADTQSGLRAFRKSTLRHLNLVSSGYEVSTEIILKAKKQNLSIKSCDINAIYNNYTLKKGQQLSNIVNITAKIFAGKYLT